MLVGLNENNGYSWDQNMTKDYYDKIKKTKNYMDLFGDLLERNTCVFHSTCSMCLIFVFSFHCFSAFDLLYW